MFIDKNKLRVNIYAPYTDADGNRYGNLTDPATRAALGIEEIAEPVAPEDYSDDLYYRTEQLDAPYVIYTKKSDEQIAQVTLAKAKAAREAEVAGITVTTAAGNEFDGNEVAQTRMARAIISMGDADTLPWVLANNSVVEVTKAELSEALKLAGATQAAAWVKPYIA